MNNPGENWKARTSRLKQDLASPLNLNRYGHRYGRPLFLMPESLSEEDN